MKTHFCLLVLVIITIVVLLPWGFLKNRVQVEGFLSTQNQLFNSVHFNQYIDSIHPNMYPHKMPGSEVMTRDEFRTHYIRAIRPLDTESNPLLTWLEPMKRLSWKADEHCQKMGLNALRGLPWYLMVNSGHLEQDMPFTLNQSIVLPSTYIEKYIQGTVTESQFLQTLIHEKIHLLQRQYQQRFNELYASWLPFAKRFYGQIPESIVSQYMTNPDSNGEWWTYRYMNADYLPVLMMEQGKLVEKGFDVKDWSHSIDLKSVFLSDKVDRADSVYHPNEIMACAITKQIMDGHIRDPTLQLFLQEIGLTYPHSLFAPPKW